MVEIRTSIHDDEKEKNRYQPGEFGLILIQSIDYAKVPLAAMPHESNSHDPNHPEINFGTEISK